MSIYKNINQLLISAEENAEGEASEEIKNTKPRYSKSQARQRYKKGKM